MRIVVLRFLPLVHCLVVLEGCGSPVLCRSLLPLLAGLGVTAVSSALAALGCGSGRLRLCRAAARPCASLGASLGRFVRYLGGNGSVGLGQPILFAPWLACAFDCGGLRWQRPHGAWPRLGFTLCRSRAAAILHRNVLGYIAVITIGQLVEVGFAVGGVER